MRTRGSPLPLLLAGLVCGLANLPGLAAVTAARQNSCGSQYRALSGRCSNVYAPDWGRKDQYLSSYSPPVSRASALSSKLFAELSDRAEPVTEWLAAWAAFIKSDLLDLRETVEGLQNEATPVLDLSQLYGTQEDQILIDPTRIDETWEIGEKTVWLLLEAEYYRLTEELAVRNQGWGTVKVQQEARKIMIGQYQNIVLKEVAPLLLGQGAQGLQQDFFDESAVDGLPLELVVGLHAHLGMGVSTLEARNLSSPQLMEEWPDLADNMLGLRLQIPGGGITMDRLRDVSDLLDLTGHLRPATWLEVREDCGLHQDVKTSQIISRSGGSVDTVDVLLGGLVEEPGQGAILSPTMACLWRKALHKLTSGDSYWYSREPPQGFSPDQISSLQVVTLSSLLCEALTALGSVQPNAFLLADASLNHAIPCRNIPRLNLGPWQSSELSLEPSEETEINLAIAAATNNLMSLRKYEYRLYQDNFIAPRRSPSRSHGLVTKPSLQVLNRINDSALFEFVTYEFMRRPKLAHHVDVKILSNRRRRAAESFSIMKEPVTLDSNAVASIDTKVDSKLRSLPRAPVFTTSEGPGDNVVDAAAFEDAKLGKCLPSEDKKSCEAAPYRTYSGYCNNLGHPKWGMSHSIHRRFLPSEYEDHISSPRSISVRGSRLPNPRLVSSSLHTQESVPDNKYTMMLMQWGQFVDHDLTHTPTTRGFFNTILGCGKCSAGEVHPACLPIPIPEDDDFYALNPSDPKCIPFARSIAGQLSLGPREQINQLSHYLDGSAVYGSDECQAAFLREPNSFLLKASRHPRGGQLKDMLPITKEHPECFSPSGECFFAGDGRVNEQPTLTIMHLVWMREHNRLALELARLNPQWETDRVFEETRRIVAAEIAHITFNEFLPRVLGRFNLQVFDLDLKATDYYNDYDPECSATSFNEFATAAFRFGHSLLRPSVVVMSDAVMMARSIPREILLRDHFNNPKILLEAEMVDDMLRGLFMTPMETMDSKITEEVKNHLFEQKGKPKSGMDLITLNIHRAREHGIPGYNKYREMCQLKRAKTFLHFSDQIPLELIKKMQSLYKHPDDVDLFSGLLAETPVNGAITGPTLSCLIAIQFSHVRRCDRFWYETGDPALRFTKTQLKELRGVSLASVLCNNMDSNSMMPRSVMDQTDRLTNPLVKCGETVKHLDLSHWKDRSELRPVVCQINGQSVKDGDSVRVSPCTSCLCTPQGSKCETVNLFRTGSSCLEIVKRYGVKAVEKDQSCRPQCRIL